MENLDMKYELSKIYLKEFQYFNGEYDVKFDIIGIDTEKMNITLAMTELGKISVVEYDLLLDKDNNLYFEYGCEYSKIYIDDFEE